MEHEPGISESEMEDSDHLLIRENNDIGPEDGSVSKKRKISQEPSTFSCNPTHRFKKLNTTDIDGDKENLYGSHAAIFKAYIGQADGSKSGDRHPSEQPRSEEQGSDEISNDSAASSLLDKASLVGQGNGGGGEGGGGGGEEGGGAPGGGGGWGPTTNVLREAILDEKSRRVPDSYFRFGPDILLLYQKCCNEAKCFRCEELEMAWRNDPCGHEFWCTFCKTWALRVVRNHPHLCVICDAQVHTLEQIPGQTTTVFGGKIPVKVKESKQAKKNALKLQKKKREAEGSQESLREGTEG